MKFLRAVYSGSLENLAASPNTVTLQDLALLQNKREKLAVTTLDNDGDIIIQNEQRHHLFYKVSA